MAMVEIIATAVLDAALGKAVDAILEHFPSHAKKPPREKVSKLVIAKPDKVLGSLTQHLEELRSQVHTVNFQSISRRKLVRSIFVNLDIYTTPISEALDDIDELDVKARAAWRLKNSEPMLSALTNHGAHCILLGQAGAGKTTCLQKICVDYFASGKALLNNNAPILLRLRDIRDHGEYGPIFSRLCSILGLRLPSVRTLEEEWNFTSGRKALQNAVSAYLDGLNLLILFDGFDEVIDVSLRGAVLQDIEQLAYSLATSRVIITSRPADFPYVLNNSERLEIAALTQQQLRTFANRWFGSPDQADKFLRRVDDSPYSDTTVRPLTIAHLCAVFEKTGDIPEKPKSVYRKIVMLLVEEWDSQRGIRRMSAYANFDSDRRVDFLAHVAFVLTTEYQRTKFDSVVLREIYQKICFQFGLPVTQAHRVVKEIESHSGLVLESSHRTYEFAHKSLQEFLTAEYIVRLPDLAECQDVIGLIPNELAIAVALSSHPANYFARLVLNFLPSVATTDFVRRFVARLIIEKPDFVITPLFTVSVCAAFSSAREVTSEEDTLLKMVADYAKRSIEEYYTGPEKVGTQHFYRRIRPNAHYTLPSQLIFSDFLMNRLRLL